MAVLPIVPRCARDPQQVLHFAGLPLPTPFIALCRPLNAWARNVAPVCFAPVVVGGGRCCHA